LFRRGIPDDFVEFVADEKDALRADCETITGHEELADALRRDLLASVALRWRWLRLRDAPNRVEAARGLLRRSVHREERSWPADRDRPNAPRGRQRGSVRQAEAGRMRVLPSVPMPDRPDRSPADLSALAWSRARQIRRTRSAASAVALVCVATLALISPRLVRQVPPPATGPTAVPAGVLLMPPYDKVASLPERIVVVSPNLNIGTDAVPLAPAALSTRPPGKVTALIKHADGPVYAFVPDGSVRTIDNPELTTTGTQLFSTTLAPDGLHAVFPAPNGVYVLDFTTAKVRQVDTGGPPASVVWRDNRTVMAPNFSTAVQIDIATGTYRAVATSTGSDVVAQQGEPTQPMMELLPANESPRLRLWRTEPVTTTDPVKASPAVTDVEDRPIFGPKWVGRWTGPAYTNGDLIVRACGPDTIPLPTRDGTARSAIAALGINGLYIATLVGTDMTTLDVLGMVDPQTVLINATGPTTTTLLAWAPRTAQLQRVATVSRTAVVSVADPLAGEAK
jgi:hypothetical protein